MKIILHALALVITLVTVALAVPSNIPVHPDSGRGCSFTGDNDGGNGYCQFQSRSHAETVANWFIRALKAKGWYHIILTKDDADRFKIEGVKKGARVITITVFECMVKNVQGNCIDVKYDWTIAD